MEQRNNLVLQGTETFSRGQLDNVALENGALVLDSVAGRSLQYGSYTTPEFAMPAFCNLNVSWNAFAPHNTMVEVRCRVYAGRNVDRLDELWQVGTGLPPLQLHLPERGRHDLPDGRYRDGGYAPGGGTGVQLQVNLSTNDDKVTPAVRLLAAAVRPLAWEKHSGHPAEPAALSAGILPFRPRPQLWPGDGSAAGHGGPDEPLGRGYPARRSGLRHGGHGHPQHRQRRLCGGCRRLLRLPLLAGLDGPCRPARPDPRRLLRWRCRWSAASGASATRCGSGWGCGALATTTP